ncbi:MAG: hypothetical protein QM817_33935 [Archangium sp.]
MSDPSGIGVPMIEHIRFELPKRIQTRRDAFQLWCHLLELGIGFHWDDDPTDWLHRDTREQLLTNEVAAAIHIRMKQAKKHREFVSDAVRLVAICRFVGPELLEHVDLDDIPGSFARLHAANAAAYARMQRLMLKAIARVDPNLRPRRMKRENGLTFVL